MMYPLPFKDCLITLSGYYFNNLELRNWRIVHCQRWLTD